MDKSKNLFTKFGFVSIGLCALCCALPIIGMSAGVGALTVLSKYFEWAGFAALVLSIGAFGYYFIRRKSAAPSCDIDCDCKTEETKATKAV
jgi:hypothetical protein